MYESQPSPAGKEFFISYSSRLEKYLEKIMKIYVVGRMGTEFKQGKSKIT